ncbi:hypothetical protein AOLI_G00217680 [Acnodon oligacanthus]
MADYGRPTREFFRLLMKDGQSTLGIFEGQPFFSSYDQAALYKIKERKTEEAWKNHQDSLGDWIADCGVPGVYEAKVHDVPQILSQVVKHFIFHRTANMVEQFK